MPLPRAWSILILSLFLTPTARAGEIHAAAREGDLDRVTALIASDAEFAEQPGDDQARPMHHAAIGGHVEVMAVLLDHGAALDPTDGEGNSPLHWAAAGGQIDAIDFLLDGDAEIDPRNYEQETPLYMAVQRKKFETVEHLVDWGADLEARNDYGRTPLLWNVREGGDLKMARLLLSLGADVNAPDRSNDTPLSLAAWRGFGELVDVLLDQGAKVESKGAMGAQLLTEATGRGLDRLYRELVAVGVRIDLQCDERGSLLHRAAAGGSPEIVADLVERGAQVDAVDAYGWRPLHYAADRRRPGVTAELLEQDKDVDARTHSGHTALSLAIERSDSRSALLLREAGATSAERALPELKGPYFGQTVPGQQPRPFAPDLVSTPHFQHGNVTISPDGREIYWGAGVETPDSGYGYGTILFSREEEGGWTAPEIAPFAGERQGDDVPFFSPDGRQLFFMSGRPLAPGASGGKENIWRIERTESGWSEPEPLPPIINRFDHHWQFSVAANGSIYFSSRVGDGARSGLYCARNENGRYQEPEFLGFSGSTPFIAPDESYLITMEFAQGRSNFIRYRQDDGGWSEKINITAETGRGIGGICPKVSPDGSCFFFLTDRTGSSGTWWVAADFIDELRP